MARLLFLALLVLVSASVDSVFDPPDVRAADPDTLRIATFNIHKGADDRNRYDLQRTIAAIASFDADLVGVQEVLRNHPQFNCDDQPALITAGLRRLTGRHWTHAYVASWITTGRECLQRGRGDDIATEGLAFFAPEPLVATAHVRLPENRIGLMARSAAMPDVPVIVTHLAASRRNRAHRVSQIATLLPWALAHGPGILMGDLNARPDAAELEPVFERYRDAWDDARSRGLAAGVLSGSTRPGGRSRIDFVLYAPRTPLRLEAVEVVDTSSQTELDEVSDHRPVVATFRRPRP